MTKPMPLKSDKEADERAVSGARFLVQTVLGVLIAVAFFGLAWWMFTGR